MYGGLGMSAPSLHRESTDSLICSSFLGFGGCVLFHAHCSGPSLGNNKLIMLMVVWL